MNSSSKDFKHDSIVNQYVNLLLSELHNVDRTLRDKTVLTLQQLDRGTVIGLLHNLLNNPDSDVQADAAEALLRIDPNQSIDFVLPLLTDPDISMRWHICGLLHDFGDKRAVQALVKVLLEDSDGDVRWMAAWALGEIGDHSALPALHQAAESDDGADREGRRVSDAAVEAIEEILARNGNEEP